MADANDPPDDDALVSVQELLRLPADKHGKRLQHVLNAIDRLHGVPRIKPIAVEINLAREDLGRYVKHPGTGEPLKIEVSCRQNDRLELTFAHEIGPFLEGTVLPGSAFGVRNWVFDEVTRGWRIAVRSTDSFQKLQSIAHREAAPRFVSYLISDQEL